MAKQGIREGEPQPQTGLDFGAALKALEAGGRVLRAGWNGKGMALHLVPGSVFHVSRPPLLGIYPRGKEITYLPHIDMVTVTGAIVPWVPSQTDVLAKDWVVLAEVSVVAAVPPVAVPAPPRVSARRRTG